MARAVVLSPGNAIRELVHRTPATKVTGGLYLPRSHLTDSEMPSVRGFSKTTTDLQNHFGQCLQLRQPRR